MEFDPSKTKEIPVDPADAEKNKVISALAYIWILFFLPLVACPKSRFGRFHANQGLILFVFSTIGVFVLNHIPLIGKFLSSIFCLLILILAVIGIINALSGRARELPVIGTFHWIQ